MYKVEIKIYLIKLTLNEIKWNKTKLTKIKKNYFPINYFIYLNSLIWYCLNIKFEFNWKLSENRISNIHNL